MTQNTPTKLRSVGLLAAVAFGLTFNPLPAEALVNGSSPSLTQTQAQAANSWAAARLRGANGSALWRLGLIEDLAEGKLTVTAPPERFRSASQRALIASISERYGAMMKVEVRQTRFSRMSCKYPFCDPPLRGGIEIDSLTTNCTGAFLARSRTDNKLYQLTAGHCNASVGDTWWTRFASAELHYIGPFHRSTSGFQGDAGIIRVNNPAGWRARAWVQVTSGPETTADSTYPILSDGNNSIGHRVCVTGARFGRTNCGTVMAVNVTADFGDSVVTGLAEASICAIPGDSGGPVFSGHTAYGLMIGTGPPCDSVFEPAKTAETLLNVNIAHDAR